MSDRAGNRKSNLALIFGAVFAVIAIIMRTVNKSPYEFLHKIDGGNLFSPFWLFSLIFIASFFLCGYYLGRVIDSMCVKSRCVSDSTILYKGGVLFTILFFMSLWWYPTLFAREAVILSFFIAIICFLCSVALVSIWSKIKGSGTLFGVLICIWWLYVTALNFLLIFKL